MKKVIGILMVLAIVMTTTAAFAAPEHYIWGDVYKMWRWFNGDIIDLCNKYYNGTDQDFVSDGVCYSIGHEFGYGEEHKDYTEEQFAHYAEETYKSMGIDATCTAFKIGEGITMDVIWFNIYSTENLREIEDFNFGDLDYDDGSDVYVCRMIFYKHVY